MLTRESAIAYLSAVTVAPITSTIRGVPSEVRLTEADGMKGACAVNLHNVVTVSKAHLGRRVAVLSAGANERNLRRPGLRSRLYLVMRPVVPRTLPRGSVR